MSSKCPNCQSVRVVEGKHFNWIAGGSVQYFKPEGLRALASHNHIPIKKGSFLACVDCGLLWSEVDPRKLRSLLTENGKQTTKARLGL